MPTYVVTLITTTNSLVKAKDEATAMRRAEAVANAGYGDPRTKAVHAQRVSIPRNPPRAHSRPVIEHEEDQ